ncbi:coiled-coil domain-containing protein 187 isoform X2 [Onychostoma macrolepis]|nr:coiled-coil domain-containing protein 187 isoform X2 [Onychostoma macrolepis]
MLQHQTTHQLEERDSEYARMIQEENQRRADEARRREVEDEEIAKRIQEEEELYLRHRSSYQHKDGRESTSIPARPYLPRPVHVPHNRSTTRRWQHSSSPTYSDSEEDLIEYSRPAAIRQNSKPTVGQRRLISRPSRAHLEQDDKSMTSQSSSNRSSHLSGGWGDVIKLIKNDMNEQGYLSHSSKEDLFEPVYKLEKILRQKQQVSGTGLSRHSSMREDHNRMWQGDGCGRRESFRERHVNFLDEQRRSNSYLVNGYRTFENGHRGTRERVQCSAGMLRDDHTHLRETQGLHTQAQGFRRNISVRCSYHGNVRRTSVREGSRTCSVDDSNLARPRPSNNAASLQPRVPQLELEVEDRLRDTRSWEMVRGRNAQQRAQSLTEDERRIDRDHRRGDCRVRRSQSERCQTFEEERSSTEEELERESRREERRIQRLQSCSGRSSGAGPSLRSGMAALDLGDLEQVLLDEELARRLQEEEERLAEETQQGSSPLRRDCPIGDFRAAQVAQDEEIARFMQKQEIKAKRRSRELEPVREYGENDRKTACDRQRQRLDSEGLQSPVDDLTPDNQHPSHVSMTMQPQAIRNIAEELDPTFQRKDAAESDSCQNQTSQQVGLYSPLEEPTFVPPTKRQSDKLGRVKPKEKKENAKQKEKENCKQQ